MTNDTEIRLREIVRQLEACKAKSYLERLLSDKKAYYASSGVLFEMGWLVNRVYSLQTELSAARAVVEAAKPVCVAIQLFESQHSSSDAWEKLWIGFTYLEQALTAYRALREEEIT
jgi:hypothetical protein